MGLPTHIQTAPSTNIDQDAGDAMPTDPAPGHHIPSRETAQSQPDSQNANQMDGDGQLVKCEDAGDGELGVPIEIGHVSAKKKSKKKKKKKPASKRGVNKPTGMEEFFADAPLTPEQVEEEQELYESHLPFIDRILTAIQRFERTRKLTPERRDIFYKWLIFGGIEVGPNMFQSMDTLDTANMTKHDLATAMSQVSLGTDKYNTTSPDAVFAVDFLGCMKGFLSRHAARAFGLETREKVIEVTSTLERFMDYLMQHDVCPEHQKDVIDTRNLCRAAGEELWAMTQARRRLPGDFNIACSTIFGGEYARGYDGVTSYMPETPGESSFVGLTKETATQIINFAMAGQAPEAIYLAHMALLTSTSLTVIETRHSVGLEVTHIEPPTKDTLDIYRTQARDFRPVGTLHAKPWHNPELPPSDLTAAERAQASEPFPPHPTTDDTYILLMEQATLLNLRPGSKLQGTLHKLASGLWFLDEFLTIYPTFDTYLCNELMADYKKPRWLAGSVPFQEQEECERAAEELRIREEREREAQVAEQAVGGGETVDGSVDASGEPRGRVAVPEEDVVASQDVAVASHDECD